MAENTSKDPATSELPPEAIAFAGRMYDAARTGQIEVFEQALPAGLPPNLTNDKGDTLVRHLFSELPEFEKSRGCPVLWLWFGSRESPSFWLLRPCYGFATS